MAYTYKVELWTIALDMRQEPTIPPFLLLFLNISPLLRIDVEDSNSLLHEQSHPTRACDLVCFELLVQSRSCPAFRSDLYD